MTNTVDFNDVIEELLLAINNLNYEKALKTALIKKLQSENEELKREVELLKK